jgi:hypothetical protein
MKAVRRSLRTEGEKAEEDKIEESTELKLTVNKKGEVKCRLTDESGREDVLR